MEIYAIRYLHGEINIIIVLNFATIIIVLPVPVWSRIKKDWLHLVLALLYLCYLTFDLIQPNEVKYNSYVYSFHPDWPKLSVKYFISNDPLGLKNYLNTVTGIQLIIYTSLALRLLVKKGRLAGESIFRANDEVLRSLRNMVFHIIIVVVTFIIVKLCFKGDLGD